MNFWRVGTLKTPTVSRGLIKKIFLKSQISDDDDCGGGGGGESLLY